jgi:hypothetical protein
MSEDIAPYNGTSGVTFTPVDESVMPEKKRGRPAKTVMRKVKFINNEDPDADVTFTYVGADLKPETYRLFPGLEYELPDYIVKHLNSLSYPIYQPVEDPITGMLKHTPVGSINRFSCHPVE